MVSACLMGVNCRYDGRHSARRELIDLAGRLFLVPFCPEQLGGLPTPRPAANITGGDGSDIVAGRGRIVNLEGLDVTGAFLRGAEESMRLAELYRVRVCIMKDKSPSCGFRSPYCETVSGFGIGVTASVFRSRRIRMVEVGRKDPFPGGRILRALKGSGYGVEALAGHMKDAGHQRGALL